MSDTPETDGFFFKRGSWSDDTLAFCRKLERERDEAREKLRLLEQAALAVVRRWDQPSWKDVEPTAAVIYKLRNALEVEEE